MKVVTVGFAFSPVGGGEIIAYNTHKLLEKDGWESYYWSTKHEPYFEKDYEYISYFTEFYRGTKCLLKNPIRYYYNYKAKSDFNKFLKQIKPDIIHLHGVLPLTGAILECCKNYPTIMTVHSSDIICPASTLMFKNKEICKDIKCKNKNYLPCIFNKCNQGKLEPSIRKAIYLSLFTKNLKYIDKYITPSEALRQNILKANIGIREDDIVAVNNFLSNTEIQTVPNYKNKQYFLFVGRLSPEKNISLLLKALKDLPRDIELHLVGNGSEGEKLKNYANENGLTNVKFQGFKNREEIFEEYQNCIATILPCYWFENFPTTNMESFINGKPVIASNIGGIPEQVEHNKTGLLFEPGNVEQLKDCIMKYHKNPDIVIEHGKNAYKKASEQYNESVYYNKLMQSYENLITKTRSAGVNV